MDSDKNMKRALIIGCEPDGWNIHHAIEDAQLFHMYIKQTQQFADSNVTLLINPSRHRIFQELQSLIDHHDSIHTCWIYYAGPGTCTIDISGIPTPYSVIGSSIIPFDVATYGIIHEEEIYRYLREFKCPLVCISDSCNHKALCDFQYSFMNPYGTVVKTITNTHRIVSLANKKIVVISFQRNEETDGDDGKDRKTPTKEFIRYMESIGGIGTIDCIGIGIRNICLQFPYSYISASSGFL